jgi:uncharacterized protein YcfJ
VTAGDGLAVALGQEVVREVDGAGATVWRAGSHIRLAQVCRDGDRVAPRRPDKASSRFNGDVGVVLVLDVSVGGVIGCDLGRGNKKDWLRSTIAPDGNFTLYACGAWA